MNIGNRKKRSDDEYLPEFKKRCDLPNLNCKNCGMYDQAIGWCKQYLNERYELLRQGKKIKHP